MSIPFKQNERCYTFDCLPKGERRLQFIFRNETNQPLCSLLIKIHSKKLHTHELNSGEAHIKRHDEGLKKIDHKKKSRKPGSPEGVSISSNYCDCNICKRKRKHDCHHGRHSNHDHGCCDHHSYDPCKQKKKKDCKKPQPVKIAKAKVQTTFCADVLEWCPPSKKVCIDFEDVFYGKCIPFHAPNNVLILTLEFTKPLCGNEVLTFEPGSGYGPVLINDDHFKDDCC
ncbi:hypothetical protein [Paenibacillus aquistagni]|uniref:Uncharacterized protein n=1 Tax=Paenibacillus aquistagni TaxID=1852522 RepID=A0A1X7I1J7_9BACL|nr:hypothetical protein [Paenibacillus aquistagni]SMG07784.1 hypothetical protein SAMN06295960_0021 [Paenibacillus aquistagni]